MTTVEVAEQTVKVEVVDNNQATLSTTTVINVVEVGARGPQGPAGQGLSAGLLANRPASGSEGDIYASTDVDAIHVWWD